MPNILTLTSENPDELLNTGAYGVGALIRVQSSATETGSYVDLAGTGSTPAIVLVEGTRSYTAYDPAGTSSTWYRHRYENTTATRVSDWTAPFQVAGEEGSDLLASLYDVKQELGLAASDTTEDENLLGFLRAVSDEIMDYTGRRFARLPSSGTATFLLGAQDYRRTLYVPQGIAALSTLEVAVSTQPETGGTYTTVTAADVFLRPLPMERSHGWPATRIELSEFSSSLFYPGFNTVRMVGALGWDRVPTNIAAIARRAVIGGYLSKGSGTAGPAIVGPTGAMIVLRGISPADQAVLDRYRAPMVGG